MFTFSCLLFYGGNKWQVNIKIWQVNIKIWQVDINIWQVNIIIWQVMAEICHHTIEMLFVRFQLINKEIWSKKKLKYISCLPLELKSWLNEVDLHHLGRSIDGFYTQNTTRVQYIMWCRLLFSGLFKLLLTSCQVIRSEFDLTNSMKTSVNSAQAHSIMITIGVAVLKFANSLYLNFLSLQEIHMKHKWEKFTFLRSYIFKKYWSGYSGQLGNSYLYYIYYDVQWMLWNM